MKLESVGLGSVNVTEKMVQEQIADDPSILGLGELELRDKERIHARAGRLDLLLQDPETLKRITYGLVGDDEPTVDLAPPRPPPPCRSRAPSAAAASRCA